MRILYLSADFGVPVLGFKGASVHVRELTDALVGLGHEVTILTPNAGEGNSTRARVILVPAPHLPRPATVALRRVGALWGRGERLPREVRELRYNPVLLRAAHRLVREWSPELVYERYALYGLAGGALARRTHLPHVLEVNAPLRLERRSGPGLAFDGPARWCERRIFRAPGRVLCVSQAVADYAIQRGAQPGRVVVQPNAVDATKFQPDDRGTALRAQLGFGTDDVVAGFVGSLKPWHGVEQLVTALAYARASTPQLRLLVVGDGPARASIERLAAERGVTAAVALVGNIPHADIPHYLATMDIAVAPYLERPDFYFSPLKVFEYMAAGRPVIVPRLGQIPELLADGDTGLLYTPGDIDELAAHLMALARQPGRRAALGMRAAVAVRAHHTWEASARRVVALGAEAARTHGAHPPSS